MTHSRRQSDYTHYIHFIFLGDRRGGDRSWVRFPLEEMKYLIFLRITRYLIDLKGIKNIKLVYKVYIPTIFGNRALSSLMLFLSNLVV